MQETGYRSWMRSGLLFSDSNDLMYIGPKSNASDVTDFNLTWSDNPDSNDGPDNMRFAFTSAGGLGTTYNELLQGQGPDGREIMRFNGNGNVGIGPMFTNAAQPQADLHIHTEQNPLNSSLGSSSIQLSLEALTGGTATDGFRISTDEIGNANEDGTVRMRQFENNSIRIMTAYNDVGNPMGERMRITSITDPMVGNPAGLPPGNTRIGICSNGASPIARIRSVLHIGTELNSDDDGWRSWMNVGTLNVQGDKHAYFGVRPPEVGSINTEAVASWGRGGYVDGSTTLMPLRFIFTTDVNGGASDETPSHTNGREIARMTSNGRMAIGTQIANNTLEINSHDIDPYYSANNLTAGFEGSSGLRFTRMRSNNLAVENPGDGVLSVDASGNVIYVEGGGGCEWDEDGTNLFMGVAGACHSGKAAIGILPTWSANTARLTIRETAGVATNRGLLVEANSVTSGFNTGIYGVANGGDNRNRVFEGYATGSSGVNYGGDFYATALTGTSPQSRAVGSGGHATALQQDFNSLAIGAEGSASFARENYGVFGSATGASWSTRSIGVYGEAGGSGTDIWAMWANGPAFSTVGWTSPSDLNLKDNVEDIENATEILSAITTAHYNFRTEQYPQLNLPEGNHYGVISQQLEEVLPNLVKEVTCPAKQDTLGNIISEAVTFKGVNYNELIPILIAGFKEQQSKINAMQEQINGCCSAHGEVTPDSPGMPTGNPQHQQSITLTNADKAMLGFASPNPNKGEVYVDYYIPTGHSGTAEMLFTDATGRPVQNVVITGKGNGRLNIDTATLAAGQYQYTLIVDGEIIATRKMIRE